MYTESRTNNNWTLTTFIHALHFFNTEGLQGALVVPGPLVVVEEEEGPRVEIVVCAVFVAVCVTKMAVFAVAFVVVFIVVFIVVFVVVFVVAVVVVFVVAVVDVFVVNVVVVVVVWL